MKQDNDQQRRYVLPEPRVLLVGIVLQSSVHRQGLQAGARIRLYGQESIHLPVNARTWRSLDVRLPWSAQAPMSAIANNQPLEASSTSLNIMKTDAAMTT